MAKLPDDPGTLGTFTVVCQNANSVQQIADKMQLPKEVVKSWRLQLLQRGIPLKKFRKRILTKDVVANLIEVAQNPSSFSPPVEIDTETITA